MRLRISADAEWQSGVGQVVDWLATTNYFDVFENRDYGAAVEGMGVFLICRDPIYGFKRRIKHLKKDKRFYMDIMLNLSDFVDVKFEARRILVLKALVKEVPEVLKKYSFVDFDRDTFLADFNKTFSPLADAAVGDSKS